MDKVFGRLTVFFEKPFWVGIFEIVDNGKLSAAKVVFGAEPKDCEVYEFILRHYYDLRFSPSVDAEFKEKKQNPKKVQCEIKKTLQNTGTGTKSQQAIKLQHEQSKAVGKENKRLKKEADEKRKFELKQQKKREKHRGR